jgi:3-oxoacyl-[acyl-carrier-protein] synthase II
MSRVFVCGLGAVSPAGWGVAAMREALAKGEPLPAQPLERPGWTQPLRARVVPPSHTRLPFLGHPRLRRTSPITHYAAAAALEAVAAARPSNDRKRPLGVIVCLQSGCVQYSYRFFEETLKDPATASPLLFPETVFAAPASHVAALLENTPLAYTLTGDPACFLQGMVLGVQWLQEHRVEACVIIGAEESNWLLADALWTFEHQAIIGAGAGAVCLTLDPALSLGVELDAITDAHTYTTRMNRTRAARLMREQLPPGSPSDLLCDGISGSPRADAAELAAWRDWAGARVSPKRILGEGLMAAGAWQCVAACDGVGTGQFAAAVVGLVGSNQQALGARFVRTEPGISHLLAEAQQSNIQR